MSERTRRFFLYKGRVEETLTTATQANYLR